MSNLFFRHFTKVIESHLKINLANTDSAALRTALSTFRAKYDLKDFTILHRFPRKDMKTVVSLPCPIKSATSDKNLVPSIQTIGSIKNLRYAFGINEYKTCHRCPLQSTCKYSEQVPEDHRANITDVIVTLIGFAEQEPQLFKKIVAEASENQSKKEEQEQTQPKTESKENQESEEEISDDKKESKENQNTKNENKEENNEEKSLNNLKFKHWNSSLKIVDSLAVVLDDLYQNDGLESKRFINTFLEELSKSKQAKKVQNEIPTKFSKKHEMKKKNLSEEESLSGEEEESLSESEDKAKPKVRADISKKINYGTPYDKYQKDNQKSRKFPKKELSDEDEEDVEEDDFTEKPSRYPQKTYRKDFDNRGNFGNRNRSFPNKYSQGNEDFSEQRNNRGNYNKFNRRPQNDSFEQPRYQNYRGKQDFVKENNEGFDRGYKKPWQKEKFSRDGYQRGKPRYQVDENDDRDFNKKRNFQNQSRNSGFYEKSDQIKSDRFMRDSGKDFKKHRDFEGREKPMKFNKRPDYPIVDKEDQLKRNKQRNQGDNDSFSFTETDPKTNN